MPWEKYRTLRMMNLLSNTALKRLADMRREMSVLSPPPGVEMQWGVSDFLPFLPLRGPIRTITSQSAMCFRAGNMAGELRSMTKKSLKCTAG